MFKLVSGLLSNVLNRPKPVSNVDVLTYLSLDEIAAYQHDRFSLNSIVRQRRGDRILYNPSERSSQGNIVQPLII